MLFRNGVQIIKNQNGHALMLQVLSLAMLMSGTLASAMRLADDGQRARTQTFSSLKNSLYNLKGNSQLLVQSTSAWQEINSRNEIQFEVSDSDAATPTSPDEDVGNGGPTGGDPTPNHNHKNMGLSDGPFRV